jgi:hypothetical protein
LAGFWQQRLYRLEDYLDRALPQNRSKINEPKP